MENLKIVQNNEYLIGQVVRKYRQQLNWSQEYLGFKAGLDSTYIGGLERGERNTTIKSLTLISTALGISIFTLIKKTEDISNNISFLKNYMTLNDLFVDAHELNTMPINLNLKLLHIFLRRRKS